jgi:hypothetical protein
MPSHHFPAPSSVEEYSEYFLVRDYNGQELASIDRCLDDFTKMQKPEIVERINELIRGWPIWGWLDKRFDKRMSNGIMIPARKVERGRATEKITNSICGWLDDRAEALRRANERGAVPLAARSTDPEPDGFWMIPTYTAYFVVVLRWNPSNGAHDVIVGGPRRNRRLFQLFA